MKGMIAMTNLEYESLNTAINYINNVEKGIEEIVEDFISEDGIKAKKMLPDLTEGLLWISQVIKATKEYHDIRHDELLDIYNELHEAIENNDTVLISDLLEYEIKEKLLDWQEKLIKVVEEHGN